MIDDPTLVTKLMLQIEEHLPIPANPTSATARHLRSQGLKISAERVLFIQRYSTGATRAGLCAMSCRPKLRKPPSLSR
jgi:hypothetical protein